MQDINQKLETLLFDESLAKKNNLKIFSKKKSCFLLDSKDYEYDKIYEVPQAKTLSKEEKQFFINKKNINYLLKYGQKVNIEIGKTKNEEDYSFKYYVFPVLNKFFFESPPPSEYYIKTETLFSDIELINNDILSKTVLNSSNNNNRNININEQEMKNYIYLTYIQLWAYNYWYFAPNEKEKKFNELMDVLSKISFHEVELFDTLFESLHKYQEKNKILKLYDFCLKKQITPSSYIYQTVNLYFVKNLKKASTSLNLTKVNSIGKNKNCPKKTFHSINDEKCLGDKIKFYNKQKCPECGQEIDIAELCFNFKTMKKDFFWVKCPICEKYILPKLGVLLGTEIISKKKDENTHNNFYSCNYTKFILHSPYELKINIKNYRKSGPYPVGKSGKSCHFSEIGGRFF